MQYLRLICNGAAPLAPGAGGEVAVDIVQVQHHERVAVPAPVEGVPASHGLCDDLVVLGRVSLHQRVSGTNPR